MIEGNGPPAAALRWTNRIAKVLLAIGLMQMTGFVTGSRIVRGLGAATAASPLPKVFSDVRGHETFAADFAILYEANGAMVRVPITPELYARLRGPYNRRNVYGAALSYGPRLPRDLWESVFRYGFQPGGPFQKELGIPRDARNVRVEIRTRTRGRKDVWILQPDQ